MTKNNLGDEVENDFKSKFFSDAEKNRTVTFYYRYRTSNEL